MQYETLFELFDNKHHNIDDTAFYFKNDPQEVEHFIGYMPQHASPYWAGRCDIEGGCDFQTAKELFEAPIYDGRSIKDRWNDVVLLQIGAISMAEWDPGLCPPRRKTGPTEKTYL